MMNIQYVIYKIIKKNCYVVTWHFVMGYYIVTNMVSSWKLYMNDQLKVYIYGEWVNNIYVFLILNI